MTKKDLPLVTAVTLIYNTNPRYVIEAIESVKNNNYDNLQHIIIDDCSTNLTSKNIVKQWIEDNNYKCEFIEHQTNYGVCKTLNHAISLAKGKYIVYCADDVMMPEKISREVEILENCESKVAAVYSDAFLIDKDSKRMYGWFIQKYKQFDYLPSGNLYDILLNGNFLPAMAMMWRKECIVDVGLYDEALFYEDYDLHLRIARKYEIVFNDYVSASYRIHSEGLSFNLLKNWGIDNFRIYLKHWQHPTAKKAMFNIIISSYQKNSVETKEMAKVYSNMFGKNYLTYCVKYSVPYILFRAILYMKKSFFEKK